MASCTYCGSSKKVLMDHFIPKSITKSDRFLVPACAKCNLSKRNHHPKTWFFHHVRDAKKWQAILESVGLSEAEIDEWMTPEPNPVSVATKLPQVLEERGLTVEEVAAKTGLSPTTVGKLCRGHFDRIDNHTMTTLCRFFGLKSISQLVDIDWEDSDVEGMGA